MAGNWIYSKDEAEEHSISHIWWPPARVWVERAWGSGWSCNGFMEEGEDCVFDRVWQHLGHVHHVLVSEIPVTQLWKHHLMHLPAARLRFSMRPSCRGLPRHAHFPDQPEDTRWFLEYLRCGISERLVGDYVNYVNLCAVVCLCTVMMGLKFLRRTGVWLWMHVGCPRGQVYCSEFVFLLTWMVHSWRFSYSFRDQLCVKCFSCKYLW